MYFSSQVVNFVLIHSKYSPCCKSSQNLCVSHSLHHMMEYVEKGRLDLDPACPWCCVLRVISISSDE